MKICPVEAELFHADGRTDMTTLMFAFAILQSHIKSFITSPLPIRNFRRVDAPLLQDTSVTSDVTTLLRLLSTSMRQFRA